MTKPGPIDFWFSIGSLYSYLSVMRLDRIALRRLHVRFTSVISTDRRNTLS